MKVIDNLRDFPVQMNGSKDIKSVVTIGNFDGLHLGHQKLIEATVRKSKELGALAVVMTFDPHPRTVIMQNTKIEKLFNQEDQIAQLQAMGVDVLLIQKFTSEFSQKSPAEFIDQWVVQGLKAQALIVGHDFAIGKNRAGNISVLNQECLQKNIAFDVIAAIELEGEIVSSSLIRKYLLQGSVEKAHQLLGRPYYLQGEVIKGAQRGRTINVPTANLKIKMGIVPKAGVFATRSILIDPVTQLELQVIKGVTSVGFNPTFENQLPEPKIETHLFDFKEDIYGKTLKVELIQFLRDEKKFSGIEELKNQIQEDIKLAKSILK
jgi:riboflavin kinase/FMN adenylyltransferase